MQPDPARRRPGRGGLRGRVLVAIAVAYVGGLLLAPAVTLVRGAFAEGVGAFASALARPEVVHALGLTAILTAIAVAVNTVFGVLLAWVLVRDRFRGRAEFP